METDEFWLVYVLKYNSEYCEILYAKCRNHVIEFRPAKRSAKFRKKMAPGIGTLVTDKLTVRILISFLFGRFVAVEAGI